LRPILTDSLPLSWDTGKRDAVQMRRAGEK
jgi:hypothetical protein